MNMPQKILYIEDDLSSQRLVSRVLEVEGYQVIIADSGLTGIQTASKERPDLILMDINIGDLDGYEVTTRLRSLDELNKIPIVALTANVLKGDRERALVAGCDGYIPKPIDIDSLPQAISNFLSGYKEAVPPAKHIDYLTEYNKKIVEHLESKVIELNNANQALQRLEKMKSDFIVLAAHELRTPLTLTYGYARLLATSADIKDNPALADSQIRYLVDKMFSSVSRLNGVVNDILNIALIQANQMDMKIQSVSLDNIIQEALSELDPEAKGRQLDIEITAQLSVVPDIDGDKDRLLQVFWNLLSNAIKYTPDGGQVTVDSTLEEDHVHIQIRDNGIGISEKDKAKIFERFYVSIDTDYHSSSKVDFMGGGMGIGLSIVKGIVDAHGGSIEVESSGVEGEGTIFHIKLPLKQKDILSSPN